MDSGTVATRKRGCVRRKGHAMFLARPLAGWFGPRGLLGAPPPGAGSDGGGAGTGRHLRVRNLSRSGICRGAACCQSGDCAPGPGSSRGGRSAEAADRGRAPQGPGPAAVGVAGWTTVESAGTGELGSDGGHLRSGQAGRRGCGKAAPGVLIADSPQVLGGCSRALVADGANLAAGLARGSSSRFLPAAGRLHPLVPARALR